MTEPVSSLRLFSVVDVLIESCSAFANAVAAPVNASVMFHVQKCYDTELNFSVYFSILFIKYTLWQFNGVLQKKLIVRVVLCGMDFAG